MLLFGFTLKQYYNLSDQMKRQQESINSEFAVEIARIASGIKESEVPSVLSIEHAFKASALAKHFSFEKKQN